MRGENRKNYLKNKSLTDKIILYSGIGVAILAIIVISLFMYSKSLSDKVKNSTMSLEQMANIANNSQNIEENNNEDSESASYEIGKTVEESTNELNTNSISNNNNLNSVSNSTNKSSNKINNNTTKNTISTQNQVSTNTATAETKQTENKKELSFEKPVKGEIVREYASDNLIYSPTLEEWTTHLGIDIKADKTTVVNAAEAGTIKSIKNDPRYGLTIVIEHDNTFQTVYSNLLTSEFVVEGEKVEKGQAIGTVGNTAVFEIADEPHLHFEIIKDSLQIDPSIYVK